MLTINNVLGVLRACQRGIGIAMLPDYLVEENGGLVQLFGESDSIALDAYFVYPEELKSVARVQVFRDFLVARRSAGTSDAAGIALSATCRIASATCQVATPAWLTCDPLRCLDESPAAY